MDSNNLFSNFTALLICLVRLFFVDVASYSGDVSRDSRTASHLPNYQAWVPSPANRWEDCKSLGYWYAELHR